MRRYPIGIQTFSDIRTGGYVYVDKTQYIWRLVREGKYYFLSRPRRFGKSLFISTLDAFFRGRRELFTGLAIDREEYDWDERPVLHLDLNSKDYASDDGALERMLDNALIQWENAYGIVPDLKDVDIRFANVIRAAYEKCGRQVVVLIDEYDKPLLANLFNTDRLNRFRAMMKAFYGVLKSCDQYIHFAFVTGITKFGKVSIFSDINNLRDISLLPAYNAICGISESELAADFNEDIQALADAIGQSYDETSRLLRRNYDGYHFAEPDSEGIYNPFSILNVFINRRFNSYWFQTGTPTMLVSLLQRTDTDLTSLSGSERSEEDLMGLSPVFHDPVPVIFQSGYLTIKGYDPIDRLYRLGFPNEEVERGFLNFLLPYYINPEMKAATRKISVFTNALNEGRLDDYMEELISFMADIPYSNEDARIPERRFNDVVFIITRLMSYTVSAEYQTNRGRIDLLIKTSKYIYIIEFKVDKSPEEALRQIDKKGYALPFLTDKRTVVKVGAEFSTAIRNISAWKSVTE